MVDEKTEETTQETTEETEQPTISNSDVKNHELFLKVTEELSQLRREKQEQAEAKEKAEREAAVKKAEEEQNWKALVEMREKELDQVKAQHNQQLLTMSLRAELARAGFNNDVFLRGAIAAYDGDADDVSDYVASLVADEGNKPFMASAQTPSAPTAPSTPTVTGGIVNKAKVVAMEKSSDPAERAKAREYLEDLIKRGEKLPN